MAIYRTNNGGNQNVNVQICKRSLEKTKGKHA